LVSDGELDLEPLISHRLAFGESCHTYRSLLRDRSQSLAVILNWD
ncbi:MAG: hypothetical protein QOI02_312, partial [Actinomycetota bacterium]|nr:hypothetical protein [Actinomycetota bacterium]